MIIRNEILKGLMKTRGTQYFEKTIGFSHASDVLTFFPRAGGRRSLFRPMATGEPQPTTSQIIKEETRKRKDETKNAERSTQHKTPEDCTAGNKEDESQMK